nr:MAG TPA: activated protein kinase C receptor [Caudoviricetes sp.]
MMKISFEGNVTEVLSDMKAFLQQSSALSPDVGAMTAELHPDMDAVAPKAEASAPAPAVTASPAPAPTPTPAPALEPTAPAPAPAPKAPEPPVAAVPTAPAKDYSLDELLTATAPLMDAGKISELQALMQKYGVASMMEIPKERYGELATDLRALGARL